MGWHTEALVLLVLVLALLSAALNSSGVAVLADDDQCDTEEDEGRRGTGTALSPNAHSYQRATLEGDDNVL